MKDICITVFGDSITYGMWDKECGGWVNRLRTLLEQDDQNYYTVYSLGIPGDTSTNVLDRMEKEMNARFNPYFENIIIFAIGINDSIYGYGKNAIPIENFKNNLSTLLNLSKTYTDRTIFVGLTRVDENKIPQEKNLYFETFINSEIDKYDNALFDFCKTHNIPYIDVKNELKEKDLNEGIHPNAIGHEKMAIEVLKKLHNIM